MSLKSVNTSTKREFVHGSHCDLVPQQHQIARMPDEDQSSSSNDEEDTVESLRNKVAWLEVSRKKLREGLFALKEKNINTRKLMAKHSELVSRFKELEEENRELNRRQELKQTSSGAKVALEKEVNLRGEYEKQVSMLGKKLLDAEGQLLKARATIKKGASDYELLQKETQEGRKEIVLELERLKADLVATRGRELKEKAEKGQIERALAQKDVEVKELMLASARQHNRDQNELAENDEKMRRRIRGALQEHWKTMMGVYRAVGLDAESGSKGNAEFSMNDYICAEIDNDQIVRKSTEPYLVDKSAKKRCSEQSLRRPSSKRRKIGEAHKSALNTMEDGPVAQNLGLSSSAKWPAVSEIRQALTALSVNPHLMEETTQLTLNALSTGGRGMVQSVAVEIGAMIQSLSICTLDDVSMPEVGDLDVYTALWCKPDSKTDRAFVALFDLINILGKTREGKLIPFMLLRELKGTVVRLLKNQNAGFSSVCITSAAVGCMCRMFASIQIFMAFTVDLLLHAGCGAFSIICALHSLVGAWPEALAQPFGNDSLHRVICLVIAGVCCSAWNPSLDVSYPGQQIRTAAHQVLRLGVQYQWWDKLGPVQDVGKPELWLRQQGIVFIKELDALLHILKKLVEDNGQGETIANQGAFQRASESLFLALVSLDADVSAKLISKRIFGWVKSSTPENFSRLLLLIRCCFSRLIQFSIKPEAALNLGCDIMKVIRWQGHEHLKMRQMSLINTMKGVLCEAKGVYAAVRSPQDFGQAFLKLVQVMEMESLALEKSANASNIHSLVKK